MNTMKAFKLICSNCGHKTTSNTCVLWHDDPKCYGKYPPFRYWGDDKYSRDMNRRIKNMFKALKGGENT